MINNSTKTSYWINSDTSCTNYDNHTPTTYILLRNAPPEYFPLLGIGFVLLVGNLVLTITQIRKHVRYIEGPATLLALRTNMILLSYFLFAVTGLTSMVSMRSSEFLIFIAVTYEAFCVLSFYENMCSHLRVQDFFDEQQNTKNGKLNTFVPPCCCLRCIVPPLARSERSVNGLRIAILQMVVSQTLLEIIRVINVFECKYEPETLMVYIIDGVMLMSFMVSIWALAIIFRSGQKFLAEFRYPLKFTWFKLMILVSKLLYSILGKLASSGIIHGYYKNGFEIMSGRKRAALWCNFVTVVISTLLLLLSYRLYSHRDYEPFLPHYVKDTTVSLNLEQGYDDKESHVEDKEKLVKENTLKF